MAGFLFALPEGALRRWAYAHALALDTPRGSLFSAGERAALTARRVPTNYRENLNTLQTALEDGGRIFFRYPELIGDLGRAFQYTASARETGLMLFAKWEKLLGGFQTDQRFDSSDDYGDLEAELRAIDSASREAQINRARYMIAHYAGRIERTRERYAPSTEYFRRAVSVAPDSEQSDASAWYVLMNELARDPAAAVREVILGSPSWKTLATFDDALDRLSRELTFARQWADVERVFLALEHNAKSGASFAQFAWIVGRAVEEGFLTANRSAADYFRLAYEAENGMMYYRAMAALKLGKPFTPLANEKRAEKPAPVRKGSELEFLLGLFDYELGGSALPYIRAREEELATNELRALARALQDHDVPESLRLVSRYRRRPGYELSREDLQLSHPRPFLDIIENAAQTNGLDAALLFALIRTESFFQADVVSSANAVGLAQLLPSTAADIAWRLVRAGGPDVRVNGEIDLKSPEVNAQLGAYYLRHLAEAQLPSPLTALLAYNGGQGRVRTWLAADGRRTDGALPHDLFAESVLYPETRQYARLVLSAAAIYSWLYYDTSAEEVLARVLASPSD
jgi:soluble lytic murein transglycosylase